MTSILLAAFMLLGLVTEGYSGGTMKAIAVLHPTQGNNVSGTLSFAQGKKSVHITGEISGLAPGKHGFHAHEFGDCSSPDASSAGGHFNPKKMNHGAPEAKMRHSGDLGNIEADANGMAKIDVEDRMLCLCGKGSIIGRSVVVHAKSDDLTSQPAGNSGPRVACGVIGIAK